jgi:[glutamine synthetase] adenylyltransferase / [glutamine synthetase]-adenylyl-L-tyrosine phosphorylase
MGSLELRQKIDSLCPNLDRELVDDFFQRMDDDYFSTFSPEEVCTHLRMSEALSLEHTLECKVQQRGENEFDIIIVAIDYLAEFSIFCGLLSAFGLDIRAGYIYSFAKDRAGPKLPGFKRRATRLTSRRSRAGKIVDVFNVKLKAGELFDLSRQEDFVRELRSLIDLLAGGSQDQARERLNRFLTERLEKMDEPLSGLLSPVVVDFDNQSSPEWTIMDVHSQDVFAFLYAFSNALAMRGVYIHKVRIRSIGREAKDEFFISDRWGKKIADEREQERMRAAVILIKQFTRFLPEAADPARAMRHFDQFLDKIAEENIPEQLISSEGMNMLAQLLGSSDFLWDDFLRLHFTYLLPVLDEFNKTEIRPGKKSLGERLDGLLAQAGTFEEKKRVLNQFKDRQLFLIDVKHLLEPQVTLMDFSHALTEMAEVVLDRAAEICFSQLIEQYGRPALASGELCSYTICGLGKFGGREMGYASDLELIFVFQGPGRTQSASPLDNGQFYDLLVQRVVEFIETRVNGVFHIDLRLRPHGKSGPLSVHLGQLINYYSEDGEAAQFERQSLIRLRWVAGDEALGREVERHRDRFTYGSTHWDWENAFHLRQRQKRELVKPGDVNMKYSDGGIVDIEYAIQYLQIIHGQDHPELRTTNTLEALDSLRRSCLIGEQEYQEVREGYLFLRNLIDALRIVRGDAGDLVLPKKGSEEYKSLARRLGYRERDRKMSAERLAADLDHWMNVVNTSYAKLFTLAQS